MQITYAIMKLTTSDKGSIRVKYVPTQQVHITDDKSKFSLMFILILADPIFVIFSLA